MMKRLDMFKRQLITQTNNTDKIRELKEISMMIRPRIKMMNLAILTIKEVIKKEKIDNIVKITVKEVIITRKVIINMKEEKAVRVNVDINKIVETIKIGKIMMAQIKKEEIISIIGTKVGIVNKTTEVSTIVITERKVAIEMKDVVETTIKISSKESIMSALISQKLILTQTIGNITVMIQSFSSK
jgi:hypothetical protein